MNIMQVWGHNSTGQLRWGSCCRTQTDQEYIKE